MATTYVKALAVAKAWINSRTGTLVGPGAPVPQGAHLTHLDTVASTYLFLTLPTGSVQAFGAEDPDMAAPIAAQCYGPTDEACDEGAKAYAEELKTELGGVQTPVPEAGALILVVDNIRGPYSLPDGTLPRWIVDADWFMRPL
jgi:hypothetical protein